MNKKELSEIKRRFKTGKGNITNVCGILVNERKEIVSNFRQYLGDLPEEDSDMIFSMFKKSLSGGLGKNLIDINFTTDTVMNSEDYKLISKLREEELKNDETLKIFYDKAVNSVDLDSDYLLLLAFDSYDVMTKHKDGEVNEDCAETFKYFVCAICPIKSEKQTLSYYPYENKLRIVHADTILETPQIGFMFPTFDDRSTNIYSALYFSKDTAYSHDAFAESILGAKLPMPAREQKSSFNTILQEAIKDDCELSTMKAIHGEIADMIEEHKNDNDSIPFVLTKDAVKSILTDSGIKKEKIDEFDEKYEEVFGKAELPPRNIVENTRFEVKTPEVAIKVDPKYSDIIQTKIIDGEKYIMIRAEGEITINGVNIVIK